MTDQEPATETSPESADDPEIWGRTEAEQRWLLDCAKSLIIHNFKKRGWGDPEYNTVAVGSIREAVRYKTELVLPEPRSILVDYGSTKKGAEKAAALQAVKILHQQHRLFMCQSWLSPPPTPALKWMEDEAKLQQRGTGGRAGKSGNGGGRSTSGCASALPSVPSVSSNAIFIVDWSLRCANQPTRPIHLNSFKLHTPGLANAMDVWFEDQESALVGEGLLLDQHLVREQRTPQFALPRGSVVLGARRWIITTGTVTVPAAIIATQTGRATTVSMIGTPAIPEMVTSTTTANHWTARGPGITSAHGDQSIENHEGMMTHIGIGTGTNGTIGSIGVMKETGHGGNPPEKKHFFFSVCFLAEENA
ncbi:hypothetical protein PAPYR_6072 [Paratrimastix pyriformis]|uniref:DRBM domain-containing protein n=1 Tax=Paratrimastix pyriformis TaxID=342808 RepID=A0ABQ8UKL7_9EUKA|nr:hypothetical protein PAPYR_6072 [Paratrimastix pyriformis]